MPSKEFLLNDDMSISSYVSNDTKKTIPKGSLMNKTDFSMKEQEKEDDEEEEV